MLRKNIWPFERRVVAISDTFFKDSNYRNYGIYRLVQIKYNYHFKDTIYSPDDVKRIGDIESVTFYRNEYGDTIEKLYINNTKWWVST